MFVTVSRYSFRLMAELRPATRLEGAPARARRASIELIAGRDDALMDADAYQRAVAPLGVRVTIAARRRPHGDRLQAGGAGGDRRCGPMSRG